MTRDRGDSMKFIERLFGISRLKDVFQTPSEESLALYLERVMGEGDLVIVQRTGKKFTVFADLINPDEVKS
jgi:hypothetical protein